MLKVKLHSAKLMNYEGIKTLLQCASEKFPHLSHLWLDAGYRGGDKGKDWVQKALEWSVELVECPRKLPNEALMSWVEEWAKEGKEVNWQKDEQRLGEALHERRSVRLQP